MIGKEGKRERVRLAVLGGLSALVGALGATRLRRSAVQHSSIPDWALGLAEDGAILSVGSILRRWAA